MIIYNQQQDASEHIIMQQAGKQTDKVLSEIGLNVEL